MIPKAPKASNYEIFIQTYEDNIVRATARKNEDDSNKLAGSLYRRFLKIEHTVRAIGEVVSHMRYQVLRRCYRAYVRAIAHTTQDVAQQCERTSYTSYIRPPSLSYRFNPNMDKERVFSILIRTILCFHEATELKLKLPVSYCTGSKEINYILNSTLTPLYKDPVRVIESPKIAKRFAKELFVKITRSRDWKIGVSREVTDICGNVRTTFSGRTPREFEFMHRAFPRKIPRWTDTSSRRTL